MTRSYLDDFHIVSREISSVKPFARNARTHSAKQISQIAASIREFEFTNPILIDQTDTIVAGHGRIAAARTLGFENVPTIRIENLTEEQKRAYVIADNKIAENAGWNPQILQIEFQQLSAIELDFDLEITGFETAEIDLLADGNKAQPSGEDEVPQQIGPTITHFGDLWLLGQHRLL